MRRDIFDPSQLGAEDSTEKYTSFAELADDLRALNAAYEDTLVGSNFNSLPTEQQRAKMLRLLAGSSRVSNILYRTLGLEPYQALRMMMETIKQILNQQNSRSHTHHRHGSGPPPEFMAAIKPILMQALGIPEELADRVHVLPVPEELADALDEAESGGTGKDGKPYLRPKGNIIN